MLFISFCLGFISIDCGKSENWTYVDTDTGISYAPDEAYIDSGINKNISSEYMYPNILDLPYHFLILEVFLLETKIVTP